MRSHLLSNLGHVLLLAAVCSLGCAFGEIRMHDPLQREYSLEETQKRYTDLVRFSNYELAARFVAPAVRNDYVAQMPKEKDLRFLDYESEALSINEELNEAKLRVTYTAYSPWTLVAIEIREDQVWTRPEGISNSWSVASTFHGLGPYRRKSAQSVSDAR
jgi:hypothetical protein